MDKKYLPSRVFIKKTIMILLIIIGLFVVYKFINFEKNKSKKTVTDIKVEVTKSIQKDSNNNGVPDWEEKLWGLNPNKNGRENKAIILAKRKAINPTITSNSNTDNEDEKLNDNLSKEFFAAIMSLAQDGTLDQDSISVITDSISQKIVAEPIPDTYKIQSLNVVQSSISARNEYLIGFLNLTGKYQDKDIGSELVLIIQGIASNNKQIISSASSIATSYKNFGADLAKIPVPADLAPLDLQIINDYDKNAKAIRGLLQVEKNPLIGMKALISYNKYNKDLVDSINKLTDIITNH